MLLLVSLASQVGLGDPVRAPGATLPLVIAAIAALGAGAASFRFAIDVPQAMPVGRAVEVTAATPEEWTHVARPTGAGVIAMVLIPLVLLSVCMMIVAVEGAGLGRPGVGSAIVVVVTVLTVAALALCSRFIVKASATGLTVTSVAGWPRVHIAAGDISAAEVVDVHPLADFGGWGWRFLPGAGTGIVLRKGPGIRVTRRDGRRVTVTVDDADEGAAVLARGAEQACGAQ